MKRALESLLAQTFIDWKCEVHNDDPNDSLPEQLVQQFGDARIELHQHKHNLGPVAKFNLFYRRTQSRFICLLEDDNWREPRNCQTAVGGTLANVLMGLNR